MVGKLKAIANENPDRRIFVRGDKDLPYGRIMEVMGIITQGGFTHVALLAEQTGAPAPRPRPGRQTGASRPRLIRPDAATVSSGSHGAGPTVPVAQSAPARRLGSFRCARIFVFLALMITLPNWTPEPEKEPDTAVEMIFDGKARSTIKAPTPARCRRRRRRSRRPRRR